MAAWTEDRIGRFVALYDEGLSFANISPRLGGIDRSTLSRRARKLRLAPRHRKGCDQRWLPEQKALLAKLWDEGLTTREIASRLGGAFSRNAVIGKAHRMGLSPRPSPIKSAARADPELLRQRALTRCPPSPLPAAPVNPEPPPPMNLDPVRTCQNIVSGEGRRAVMCAKPAMLKKSWCPECYVRLAVPVRHGGAND